jgi:hypothetical protein
VAVVTSVSDTMGGGTPPLLQPTSRIAPGPVRAPSAAERNATRQAERRLVVYLDEVQRRWLRGIEADALRDDVRLTASAVIRLAVDELRARRIGWRELAGRLPEAGDHALAATPWRSVPGPRR